MSTTAAGYVMVEFLDSGGAPIPGYSGENGYRMFGDDTAIKTLFYLEDFSKAKSDLSPLEGKPARIRFTMKEAKLYSIQFTKDMI